MITFHLVDVMPSEPANTGPVTDFKPGNDADDW
jgi:hypothetical protein